MMKEPLRYADIAGVVIDPHNVPGKFRHLLPLAKEWSIGDDSQRADHMFDAPVDDLQSFVDAVWPLLPAIQTWCQQFHSEVPVPDEVVVFDMMCQACAEAAALHVEPPETPR